MAKIGGLAYLLVGLLVGGASAFMTYAQGTQGFQLFIYIGGIMVAYGGVLLLIHGTGKEEPKQPPPQPPAKPATKREAKAPEPQWQKHRHPLDPYLSTCRFCHARIPKNAIFCSYCGRRL